LVATFAAFILNFGAEIVPVEVGTPTLLARMAFFTTEWFEMSDFFWNDIVLSPVCDFCAYVLQNSGQTGPVKISCHKTM